MKQTFGRYAPHALALAGVLAPAACSAPLAPPLGETDAGAYSDAPSDAQVQSGAIRAWSGGIRAWSGGIRAWSGGGELERTGAVLLENAAIWERLSLAAAHQALAPKLGRGVTVAVIDTGIDTRHPIFSGRLSERSSWYDFVDGDREPQEAPGVAFGHGTMVASIVLQLAPEATLMPLRVLDGDGGGRPTTWPPPSTGRWRAAPT